MDEVRHACLEFLAVLMSALRPETVIEVVGFGQVGNDTRVQHPLIGQLGWRAGSFLALHRPDTPHPRPRQRRLP